MKYKDINDYYLVDMICENDEDSYYALFAKYEPLIKLTVNKFYKEFEGYGYDFEDFLQEGYYALYKALKNFNPKRNTLFYTFVVLCVNRQLITFTNRLKTKRLNYIFISTEDYEYEKKFHVDYNFDDDLYFDKLIKDVIFDSDIEYSCVFELKINNFSYREIQELLDITYAQAEYRFRKMKELLKSKMENNLNKKTE